MVQLARHLPTEWSFDSNIAWTAEIEGYGQSTPVTLGKLVLITSVSGDENRRLTVVPLSKLLDDTVS